MQLKCPIGPMRGSDSFLHCLPKLCPCISVLSGMNGKTLILTGALALSILGVAGAKSYSFVITESAKVGTATLKPGEYK